MAPRTVQQAQTETTRAMMRSLFRAPKPWKILLIIVALSLLAGFASLRFDPSPRALYLGLVGFALPAVASTIATKPLAEMFGGKMYFRRSALLTLLGFGMILSFVLFSLLLPSTEVGRIVIVAWASTLWLRQIVILATSESNPLRSLAATMVQPLLGIAGIVPFFNFDLSDFLLALVSLFSFFMAGFAFAEMASRPFKRGFGVDGLSMLRHSLDHMTERGTEGKEEMEAFFNSFSAPIDAHLGIVSFKREQKIKALMVVPSVHPGPFGHLGGSDLPSKLLPRLEDITTHVLVPHGPSTHDENLATSDQCEKIAEKAKGLLQDIEYSKSASKLVRVIKGSANICCQIFGGYALLVGSLAPRPTDDLDFATGYAAIEAAKDSGAKDALFLDAHNCMELGSGMVHFGSRESQEVLDASREASSLAIDTMATKLRMGFAASRDMVQPDKGLGPMGIQVLILESNGQGVAYILFDGNNMVPGLRERIRKSLENLVDDAEVLTTDNHVVNSTIPGFNPVGLKMGHSALVEEVKKLVTQGIEDLEEVEVGAITGTVEGIRVWGHDTAARLTSVIHSTMSILRINAAVTLSLALGLAALAVVLIP